MENSTEQWKPLSDFPQYLVSDYGRVKSLRTNELLSQRTRGKWGKYVCVDLSQKGMRLTVNVHRLVARLFLPHPPTAKHQVAHNDGDPANNHASNLRWATRKENAADCLRHGTRRRGKSVNTCKLDEQKVREIRADRRHRREIAGGYGVTPQAIYAIQRRISWAWVT